MSIDKSLTLQGPGANLLTIERSNATGVPAFRLFTINPGTTGRVVNISGIRITNGRAESSSGGGILHQTGDLNITNCTVTENEATEGGGGIGTSNGAVTRFVGSTISGNTARSGGGIALAGALEMTNSTVTGNIAKATASAHNGGGIYTNSGTTISIDSITIYGNTADQGGGIYNFGGSAPRIQNTIVAGNTVTSASGNNPNFSGAVGSMGTTLSGA